MWPGPAHGLPPDPGQSSAGALPALHLGDGANTHGVLCSGVPSPPSDPRAWSCLRVGGGDSPAHHCWTEPRPSPMPAGRVQQRSAPRPEGPEHPELRRPQRLSDPQTHPKGLGHRMGEDGKVSQSGSPPRPALSGLRPACSYPRVDFVAKYLGGLREQEKRVERLECQVGRHTRAPFSPGAGAWPRGSAVRAGAGQGGPGASYLYPPSPEGETLQLSPGGSCI